MFVLPSAREGFGLVVVEANACGIPVITSTHADNAAQELIVEGQNGYLADLNAKHLARQIRLMLKAHGALDAQQAIEDHFGQYHWNKTAAAVERALASRS